MADPNGLAPERLLVFEVEGPVSNFVKSLDKLVGLDLLGEDDPEGKDGSHYYLLVPNFEVLKAILSLWQRWSNGEELAGWAPWRDLFLHLRDIRPWGPQDRLGENEREILEELVSGRSEDDKVSIEIELVFSLNEDVVARQSSEVRKIVSQNGGVIVSTAYRPEINYHGVLIQYSVREVRRILSNSAESLIFSEAVMYICPQSFATSVEVTDEAEGTQRTTLPDERPPILALLDGVPISQHRDLINRLVLDDMFEHGKDTPVSERKHGTAMASLITCGDLNGPSAALSRKIHVVPVMGKGDEFAPNLLIVDVIYLAVTRLFEGDEPTAKDVLIINISLGNRHAIFDRRISPWARLLDVLSVKYGVLFVVSSGNRSRRIHVPEIPNFLAYEDNKEGERAPRTLKGVNQQIGLRRLLSPAESMNSLTVGAANLDLVPTVERITTNIDPYPGLKMSNPTSALGPGYGNSVKPELLFPGGKEHVAFAGSAGGLEVRAADMSRAHGLLVAGPPRDAVENRRGYSGNTSGATALASRTCHLIHDALEAAYAEEFLRLPKEQRSCLLKALLVHTASWPADTAEFIKGVVGPQNPHQHVQQKDNIRRFIGYGFANPELAISCTSDRATCWAVGQLNPEMGAVIDLPIPLCIHAQTLPHHIHATLAWFAPVSSGRTVYRSVRLSLLEPDSIANLGVSSSGHQPDSNMGRRGTVFSRIWDGRRAPVVVENQSLKFTVQREPDQNDAPDGPIPFALALTVTMPTVNEIYNEVRARIELLNRVRV